MILHLKNLKKLNLIKYVFILPNFFKNQNIIINIKMSHLNICLRPQYVRKYLRDFEI